MEAGTTFWASGTNMQSASAPGHRVGDHKMNFVRITCMLLAPALVVCYQAPEWQASVAEVTVNSTLSRVPGTAFVVALKDRTAFLVTSAHVVAGDSNPQVFFVADPGKAYPATVVDLQGDDRLHGLALLSVMNPPHGVRLLPSASDPRLAQGERVTIAGFPADFDKFLTPETTVAGFDGPDLILSKNADEGFSGGPVVLGAQLVGLVFGNHGGHGLAISSEVVKVYVNGQLRKLEPPPGAHVGSIIVNGCPDGARALIDDLGQDSVATGGRLVIPNITSGYHYLRILKPHYYDHHDPVTVPDGDSVLINSCVIPDLNGHWELEPSEAAVKVICVVGEEHSPNLDGSDTVAIENISEVSVLSFTIRQGCCIRGGNSVDKGGSTYSNIEVKTAPRECDSSKINLEVSGPKIAVKFDKGAIVLEANNAVDEMRGSYTNPTDGTISAIRARRQP